MTPKIEYEPGQIVYTRPDIDTESWIKDPEQNCDTKTVIVRDENTGKLGYLWVDSPMSGDSKNARECTMFLICENDTELFDTQKEAIRAALEYERAYAARLLEACDLLEENITAR